ncbi:substrate-binding periplasmic protein [Neptunomonas antarctica]|uniref:Amino acid ABC transporter substrate-binding protein, PAAT family n=1 Tax=Neptunomonas antarctica TaxID=619304 RepID=A0A1N7KYC6_9GAMM|nr:ABC transporter substrate-binding protein [Neptunomonas antarctica]SIS66595.1 amino acid ABC transporter substrate-binding protein, PAAT family [Neptunomonas antarctica]
MKRLNVIRYAFLSLSILFSQTTWSETIQLTTESYPPFNMMASTGEVSGISTDIVRELFARNGLDYEITLLPWNRAYVAALEVPGTGVFSTTRTPDREALFKWVSPLTLNNWVLLSMKARNIQLNSLEDAKQYRIGGYRGDAIALYLEKQGFKLDLVSRDDLNALKLARKRIDLWATGHLLGAYIAKEQGVEGVVTSLTFKETTMGLAFHPDTSSALIDALNESLQAMYQDGTIGKIYAEYR